MEPTVGDMNGDVVKTHDDEKKNGVAVIVLDNSDPCDLKMTEKVKSLFKLISFHFIS